MWITDKIGLKNPYSMSGALFKKHQIATLLDLGAGTNPSGPLRDKFKMKQLLIDVSYPQESNNFTVRKSLDILDSSGIKSEMYKFWGEKTADCVICIQTIEHLEKDRGLALLDMVESLASKLIIIETPNGFISQPGSFENPFQEHKSGWVKGDFEKFGYTVVGTNGLKILKKRSDKGEYRWTFRGIKFLDVALSRIFLVHKFPSLCFNIFAFKIIEID